MSALMYISFLLALVGFALNDTTFTNAAFYLLGFVLVCVLSELSSTIKNKSK